MFGKERHTKKTVMFLLEMDCSEHPWDIPENTLWLDFNEALTAALEAIASLEEPVEMTDFELCKGESAFLPNCFEIMPISISTPNRITWWGKERKEHNFDEQTQICRY